MLFKELAILGKEQLAKQPPVTLEQAREQVKMIEERTDRAIKKQLPDPKK